MDATRRTIGARSEAPLTGVRAFALLHVLAQHSAVLLALRGSDVAGAATSAAANGFLTSWAAQPVMSGDAGVDTFLVLSG